MCGIHGFTFGDEKLIEKMISSTSHRGPDSTGRFVSGEVSLGFNRLAIIDLSEKGNQPMWNNTHDVAIIFNGEIYNYRELRKSLENRFTFMSQTDTEVILRGYETEGIGFLRRMNGMFGLCIWDSIKQELFLARDPVGIKPLYYTIWRDQLYFASEIKSLLTVGLPREIGRQSMDFLFTLRFVPEPFTMFKNIFKLPAGNLLRWRKGKSRLEQFYKLEPQSDNSLTGFKNHERLALIRRTVEEAVQRQLVSDRPLGIYLSGGIDSSVLLGTASKIRGPGIHTFTVGFSGVEKKFNQDFYLARQTASIFKSDHHEFQISGAHAVELLDDFVYSMEDPVANPSLLAIYYLSRQAKKDVTVVLDGAGGDELFLGYHRYLTQQKIARLQRLLPFMRLFPFRNMDSRWAKLFMDRAQLYASYMFNASSSGLNEIYPQLDRASVVSWYQEKYFSQLVNTGDTVNALAWVDQVTWLRDFALVPDDKMMMAASIEARVPLLDTDLIALSGRIPSGHKLSRGQTKYLLRRALAAYIPEHVINKQKSGFFSPMAKWFRTDFRATMELVLDPGYNNWEDDFLDFSAIREFWQAHINKRGYHLNLLWTFAIWRMWYHRFIIEKSVHARS